MGFFDLAAPLVRRYGDRWSASDARVLAGWLRDAVPAGGRVLDVGGGSGQLALLLADALDAHVTVLDPTAGMLAHVPAEGRLTAVSGSAEDIPFADSSFDALVVTDVFHHLHDHAAAVTEFSRVVRANGLVLVLDPDPRVMSVRLIALAERLVGEPTTFLTPAAMERLMADHGIDGTSEPVSRGSYRFLGRVGKPAPAA